MQELSEISPVFAYLLGAFTIALPMVLWVWRIRSAEENKLRRLTFIAQIQREVLSAAPDGLFLWDHVGSKQSCSRRLAVLLNLSQGTASSFDDILACFEGEALQSLDAAAGDLRRKGIGFELMLPTHDGKRTMRVLGARVNQESGAPLADLLWIRVADADTPPPSQDNKSVAEPFKPLLDALPHPVWLRDANFNIAYANRACSSEDITGPARDLASRAMETGQSVTEGCLLTINNNPHLFEITETIIEGWNGTAGFAMDMTATEKIEGEHARQDAAHDQVLENLSTAMAIFNTSARLTFFNSAYVELWGLETSWLDTSPPLSEILDKLRELRKLPEVTDFRAFKEERLSLFRTLDKVSESLMHLPDGVTLRSLVTPYGLGGLVFSYEDVSERLDLERSYNTLVAVQRESLFNMHEGVAVFGGDGRLRLSNPVFAKLWGLSAEDIESKIRLTDFIERMRPFLADVEDWEKEKSQMMRRLMSRETGGGRITRNDGTVLDYANTPLPDGAALLSYLDVSDSAKVEQALRQRAQAMEDAGRLKSEFISNVSYELRTPLTTLMGFAEILGQEYFGDLNTRQKEYSEGILTAAKGLLTVIADILDLAGIEAGNMKLNLDTVDLHSMLVSVVGLIRERARGKDIKLEFECPQDLGCILADEQRLKQALFNLLSNAVNFTPHRGTVTLCAKRHDNQAIIKVSDTGVGIPKADQNKIFNAFERGSEAKPDQGSGLGLTLVKRFIELHDGNVELESTATGTTIICRLPVEGPAQV